MKLLPADVPAFFRQGGAAAAHHAVDPDVVRDQALPELRSGEGPEHYFDIELLDGRDLPANRYDLIDWCAAANVKPQSIGMLPYAIIEQTQRLTMALAEHRAWPGNPHIRAKCLVIAGHLSHYVADSTQPLHVTIHFDGRAGEDGKVPHTGIHQRVDMLVDRLKSDGIDLDALGPQGEPKSPITPAAELMPAVWQHLLDSHAKVDRVYELEPHLPPLDGGAWEPSADVRSFAWDTMHAAKFLTARLYLTAWRDSVTLKVPHWLVRDIDEQE